MILELQQSSQAAADDGPDNVIFEKRVSESAQPKDVLLHFHKSLATVEQCAGVVWSYEELTVSLIARVVEWCDVCYKRKASIMHGQLCVNDWSYGESTFIPIAVRHVECIELHKRVQNARTTRKAGGRKMRRC